MDPDEARETHHRRMPTARSRAAPEVGLGAEANRSGTEVDASCDASPERDVRFDGSNALDGNAAAAAFLAVLGVDLTTTAVTCASCGRESPFAATRAYVSGPGVTVRCPSC